LFLHENQFCEIESQQKFVLNSVRTETTALEQQRQKLIKEFEEVLKTIILNVNTLKRQVTLFLTF